jgi:DNA repair ATPase RecN
VIKLEAAHIEEVRGIRKLDIDFGKGTFAISGPNGSGKSGVIDAIEFGLTGQIGRLTGRGTKGLSVAALADQPLPHAVQCLQVELISGLRRHELHGWSPYTSAIASASRKSFFCPLE